MSGLGMFFLLLLTLKLATMQSMRMYYAIGPVVRADPCAAAAFAAGAFASPGPGGSMPALPFPGRSFGYIVDASYDAMRGLAELSAAAILPSGCDPHSLRFKVVEMHHSLKDAGELSRLYIEEWEEFRRRSARPALAFTAVLLARPACGFISLATACILRALATFRPGGG